MTPCAWGDIVAVEFPYSDWSGRKLRPAVVVGGAGVLPYNDVLIMAITSSLDKVQPSYHLQEWQSAGLTKPCAFKPQIYTIENTLIIKKTGEISMQDRARLQSILTTITAEK